MLTAEEIERWRVTAKRVRALQALADQPSGDAHLDAMKVAIVRERLSSSASIDRHSGGAA